MAVSIVGVSFLAETSVTDPQDHAVPLPVGTLPSDLLVVSWFSNAELTDARFTEVLRPAQSPPLSGGGYGLAGDLSDVTLRFSNYEPGLAAVVAIRGGGLDEATVDASGVEGDFALWNEPEDPDHGAALVILGIGIESGAALGPVDGWDDYGTATADDRALRVAAWTGNRPVAAAEMTTYTGGLLCSFSASWFGWPTGTYLRQRQSPKRTPARVRGVDLRQRQTTFIR